MLFRLCNNSLRNLVLDRCDTRKTRRRQLVEIEGRKTGRKLTRRILIECKLVEYLQIIHKGYTVLMMEVMD